MSQFDTLVVVLMENRSFDHMLGYLSLPPWNRADIDGLQSDPLWVAQHENIHFTYPYPPFAMTDKRLPDDPPHEREYIA
ncbi:MAG: alkaline phosphatase family protein, partial [Mycobacteriales bacterium]